MTTAPATLAHLTASTLVAAYRAGSLRPIEVVHACLAQIARWQPAVNAFAHVDRAGAIAAAEASTQRWHEGAPLSPLDGVPVSVKDSLHVAGMPTHWGSWLLGDFVPAIDETPVACLRAAGAVLLGKTNCPEFTMQGYTGSPRHGITRNPWNTRLTPGGSSGGAVAALVSGCGALALATDGGGSIRRPAGYGGLAGFKPSSGTLPRVGGLPPIYLAHEVAGPMARCVEDIALAMQVLAPHAFEGPVPAPTTPTVLAVAQFGQHPVDPRIRAAFAHAVERMQSLGAQVEHADHFDLAEEINALWPRLSSAGLAWMLAQAQDFAEFAGGTDEARLGPELQAILQAGRALTASQLFELHHAIARTIEATQHLFARVDFVLTPTAAAMPWPAEQTHPTEIDGQPVGSRGHAVFTALANAAHLPALALPCGVADGLPIGVQIIGARGTDTQVLALGKQLEQALAMTLDWPTSPMLPT
jgi:aspartyl-tRNA(Asn)/glutamyl-tRNA(Gln) amidotransferase subunit A